MVEDVLRAYPDWDLKFMDGNDVHFQYKALAGDPLYSTFWDRVSVSRDDIVFGNVKEGLDMLRQERAVIHIYFGMLKAYFRSDPFRQQNLKTFAKGRAEFSAIILPFNSPLKPILQSASNTLIETGIQDAILKDWEGTAIPQAGEFEILILTTGHTILVFMLILTVISITIMILFCEIYHKRMISSQGCYQV